ncbi:MAG: ATP-binding protein [Cyclobacteriaceae bacterium]
MIRVWAINLILFLTICFGHAQTLDSLESLLRGNIEGIPRINLLCDLSNKYLAYKPKIALQYANDALKLSKDLKYRKGEALALNRISDYEFRQSNYAEAAEISSEVVKIATEMKDSMMLANAYRLLGNINNAGLERYDVAEDYQLKAYDIYSRLNDRVNVAATCGSLSWIYAITNRELERANDLADEGLMISREIRHSQFLGYNLNSKALIYKQLDKLDSALIYLDLSNEAAAQANDLTVISYNNTIKGDIYLDRDESNKAIEFYTLAMIQSKPLAAREVIKNAYKGLASAYAKIGDHRKAYGHLMAHNQLRDSLFNQHTAQRAMMAEKAFQDARQKSQIAELQLANEQERTGKLVFTILFGVSIIFSSAIYIIVSRNSRNRKIANQQLEEKNDEIAKQNAELVTVNNTKDKLFSIVGHDLRSPITSLKSLLTMVAKNEVSPEEFKMIAPKLNRQVIGVNETLENILHWSKSQLQGWTQSVDNCSLYELVKKTKELFQVIADEKNITIENKVDPSLSIRCDCNQIELILRNLIHNAIKYTPAGGNVRIHTISHDESFDICVSDNGIGMTASQIEKLLSRSDTYSTPGTSGEKGTGLGIYLCREMVEYNGGSLTVESQVEKGTTFKISFKAEKILSPTA